MKIEAYRSSAPMKAEKVKGGSKAVSDTNDKKTEKELRTDKLILSNEYLSDIAEHFEEEIKEEVETAEADEAAEETKETDDPESTSEKGKTTVAFSAAKRARQLAAAKTAEQVDMVLALLDEDLSDCKAGLEKGWCDEQEVRKVENMIMRAKEKRSQVSDEQATPQEEMNFTLSGMM